MLDVQIKRCKYYGDKKYYFWGIEILVLTIKLFYISIVYHNSRIQKITLCQLENNEYKTTLYKQNEVVQLKSFPDLKLTPEEIFQSAYIES